MDSPLLVAYGNLAIGKVCGVETLLSSSALIVFYSSIFACRDSGYRLVSWTATPVSTYLGGRAAGLDGEVEEECCGDVALVSIPG